MACYGKLAFYKNMHKLPLREKVQSRPELLFAPEARVIERPASRSHPPSSSHPRVFSAALAGLLFYFESCWTLFLNLSCYMSDRSCIHRRNWITLVQPEKMPSLAGLHGTCPAVCLSIKDPGKLLKNVNNKTLDGHDDQPSGMGTEHWTSHLLHRK